MGEDKFELQGDYTESEKAKQAKKEKKSLAAKKASETRKRKKEQKQKEEDAVFWKQQDEKGYKNLFGENNNKTDKNESKNMSNKNTIKLTESELKEIISESVKNVLVESNERDIEIKEKYKEIRNFAIKLCEFTDKHKYGDHFTHGQYMSHRTPTKKEYELRSLLFSLWNDGFKLAQLTDAVLKELE